MAKLSDTVAALLDFYQLVKAVAEDEGLEMDEAAEVAATLWPHLQPADPPRIEVSPVYAGGRPGVALAA